MSDSLLAVFATALVRIMLVMVTLVICQLEPGFVSWQGATVDISLRCVARV